MMTTEQLIEVGKAILPFLRENITDAELGAAAHDAAAAVYRTSQKVEEPALSASSHGVPDACEINSINLDAVEKRGRDLALRECEGLRTALEPFALIEVNTALQITPNGYANPAKWAEHVLAARAALSAVAPLIRAKALEEAAGLRKALEPFALAADRYDKCKRDSRPLAFAHQFHLETLTVGDLRKARAALSASQQPTQSEIYALRTALEKIACLCPDTEGSTVSSVTVYGIANRALAASPQPAQGVPVERATLNVWREALIGMKASAWGRGDKGDESFWDKYLMLFDTFAASPPSAAPKGE